MATLRGGQKVQIRFSTGQVLTGVIKAANESMAIFEPEAGIVVVLTRNFMANNAQWAFNKVPVEITELSTKVNNDELVRRLRALLEKTPK